MKLRQPSSTAVKRGADDVLGPARWLLIGKPDSGALGRELGFRT
jgi:hypothetical protein